MQTKDEMELLLWQYIDGDCNEQEQQYISEMISTDANWNSYYESLLALNKTIAGNIQPVIPSLHFTENVMDKINAINPAPAKQYVNKWVIKGIAAFFIISLTALLGYTILHTDFSKSYGSISYSRFFNADFINVFIFANIILALIFLDSLLRRRMRHY